MNKKTKKEEEVPLLYRAIVENMAEGVFLIRARDGVIVYANPTMERIFGYAFGELVGKHISAVNAPTDKTPEEVAQEITQSLKANGVWQGEVQNIKKDGTVFWCQANVSTFDHPRHGSVWVSINQDITERKRAEEAHFSKNEFNRLVIKNAGEGICVCHEIQKFPYVHFTVWNEYMNLITGYSMEEINRLGWYQSMYPDLEVQERAINRMRSMRVGDDIRGEEWEITRADGKKRQLLITTRLYTGSEGDLYVLGVMNDITERKQAEEHIRQLSRAVEASPTSIVITDSKGDIQYVNPKFTEVTGYSFSEAIGKNPRILKSGQTPPEVHAELWETITKGKEWHGEFCNRKKNGDLYWESASISPITDENDAITHYVAVKEDITERKQAEENIHRMVERWSIVYRAGEEIGVSLDTEQVFAAVYHAIEQVMPCEDFVISLYDEIRNEMMGSYILENNKRVVPNPYKADHGLGGHIIHSGQSLILNHPEQIKTSGIKFEPYGSGPITSSIVAVPMQLKGKTIGMLSAQSYHSEAYTTEDQELLEMLAGHVAVALDHARLFEQAHQEIAERKQAEASVERGSKLLAATLEALPVGVCLTDEEGYYRMMNDAYCTIYNYDRKEMIGKRYSVIMPPDQIALADAHYARLLSGDTGIPVERKRQGKDGSIVYIEAANALVVGMDGRKLVITSVRDITERKRAEEKLKEANKSLEEKLDEIKILQDYLQEQAIRDPLTGLYNRRYMEEALTREHVRAARTKEPLSIVMMDMDDLKKFNDIYGHDLGDQALKTFGNQIKLMTRAEDIACRYGGDEFLVILYNTDMENASRRVAEWHRKVDEVRIPYQDTSLHISFSAGIATYPTHGESIEEVIKLADEALYQAKRAK